LPPRGPVSRDPLSDTARNAARHLPAYPAEPFAQLVGIPTAHALRQRIAGRPNIGALVSECSAPVERGRGNAEQIGCGLRIQQVWESGDRFFTD
jgi:hypothetical protein